MKMKQVELIHGTSCQTAWIDAEAAKVGNKVQLLPSKEFWEVVVVFERTLSDSGLKELQHLNRHSLPSVEPIK